MFICFLFICFFLYFFFFFFVCCFQVSPPATRSTQALGSLQPDLGMTNRKLTLGRERERDGLINRSRTATAATTENAPPPTPPRPGPAKQAPPLFPGHWLPWATGARAERTVPLGLQKNSIAGVGEARLSGPTEGQEGGCGGAWKEKKTD